MRRRFSIPLIAIFGVTVGFTGTSALSGFVEALNSPGCAPEHPKPGDNLAHTMPCKGLDNLAPMMAREEAARAKRAKEEGPILAFLKGDD